MVLGHEGAGIVDAVGPGVLAPQRRRRRRALVGDGAAAAAARAPPARPPCARSARTSTACPTAARACGARAGSRPLHGDGVLRRARRGAGHAGGRAARGRRPRGRRADRLRRHDRRRRGLQHRRACGRASAPSCSAAAASASASCRACARAGAHPIVAVDVTEAALELARASGATETVLRRLRRRPAGDQARHAGRGGRRVRGARAAGHDRGGLRVAGAGRPRGDRRHALARRHDHDQRVQPRRARGSR